MTQPTPKTRKMASAASALLRYSTLPPISRTVEGADGCITHYFFLKENPLEYVSVVCDEDSVVLSKKREWGTSCEKVELVEVMERVKNALDEKEG